MTGFARTEGVVNGLSWVWELRSVNGRGLDLRFRLPSGWDALEPAMRDEAAKALKRGNVSANLNVSRDSQARIGLDQAALDQAMALALDLHRRIPGSPVPRAEALLALPGIMRSAAYDPAEERAAATPEVRAGFTAALAGLIAARQQEGRRLGEALSALLAEVTVLRTRAEHEAADQPAMQKARMMENLQALLRETSNLPEERIAQEIALLAARSDVREELDRLNSHIGAAHALLAEGVLIGRRFDFLVQEFNREANTLCSKSASIDLTTTGLKLKAAIDQLREQVQNIE
jgi:uncharacterized protein (TIGR00255 family)